MEGVKFNYFNMRGVKKMFYLKRVLPLIMLFSIFIVFPIHSMAADERLQIDIDLPITSKLKDDNNTEIQLKVVNRGENFSGDLVYPMSMNSNHSLTAIPFDLAKGEEKTIRIPMNGSIINRGMEDELKESLLFYENGIEKGKKVKVAFTISTYPTVFPRDVTFLYQITSNKDRLLTLNNYVKQQIDNLELIEITKEQMPSTEYGYESANIVMIEDVAIADFTEEQFQALHKWLMRGGQLIISGQDSSIFGGFESLTPLQLKDRQKFPIGELEIDARAAELKEGASAHYIGDQDGALVGRMVVGSGAIYQLPFMLGNGPQNQSTELAEWFLQTFIVQNTNQLYYEDFGPIEYVQEVNQLFEQFKFSVGAIILSILLYTIIVGPILYFILKRFDKREYAWACIPIIAVLVAVSIFFIGGKDRLLKPQSNQIALYRINQDESLTGVFTHTILTNRSGNFTFTMDKDTSGYPVNEYMMGNNPSTQNYIKGNEIIFKDARFWSTNTITGETNIPQLGKFSTNLTVSNGMIQGTIENLLPFEVHDVGIWVGEELIELGNIPSKEMIEVEEKLINVFALPAISNEYPYYYYDTYGNGREQQRIENARHGAYQFVKNEERPVIVGWTAEPLVGLSFNGNAKQETLNYFIQPFETTIDYKGEITLTNEQFTHRIFYEDQGYSEQIPQEVTGWYFDNEYTVYIVEIPTSILDDSMTFQELHIHSQAGVPYEIWNMKTQEYEEITNTWETTSYQDYIDNGEIKLRPMHISENGAEMTLPEIVLKGVVE